ncbi:MAG: PHB depolymerase family esterase [Solirubrobacteraceae bacterium]
MALVVAFHGAGGNGPSFAAYTGLSRTANRHGFAVLYPTAGSGSHFWSLNRSMAPDDVGRLRALLPQAERLACADTARMFATGVSNGGGFAARVGCQLAGTIAAVAPVAGGYRALDPCPANRRASLLEIHGTADPVVPYEGRGPEHEGNPKDFVTDWAERDGCSTRTEAERPSRLVLRFHHLACPDGLSVEHVRLQGTDHGWPGAAPPFPRRNPSGLRVNEVVWRFFAAHRLPR